MLTYAVVIPARFKSSRLPGKPLADINGKPMIQHVWEKCVKAVGPENVYVATDDSRIKDTVDSFGGLSIMTSSSCLTGTDRLAEANRSLKRDFLINVQGDEPMINPDDIIKIRDVFISNPTSVVNAYTKIAEHEDPVSTSIPKVVVTSSNRLLYISRAVIPINKNGEYSAVYKQVCIYAFSKRHLDFFYENNNKTILEEIEDIEILRFLESDFDVRMVEVSNNGIAVDTEEDLVKVVQLLK